MAGGLASLGCAGAVRRLRTAQATTLDGGHDGGACAQVEQRDDVDILLGFCCSSETLGGGATLHTFLVAIFETDMWHGVLWRCGVAPACGFFEATRVVVASNDGRGEAPVRLRPGSGGFTLPGGV
jgi:hypothetical protein